MTDGAPAGVPVPERAICTCGALLVTARLPLARPVAVGSKITPTLTAWLGASVTAGTPLTVNPAPAAETDEMLTVELPVFVSVIFWVALTPTEVLPKLTEAGLAES